MIEIHGSPLGGTEDHQSEGSGSGSGIKLGLRGGESLEGEIEDFDDEDDLEKEYLNADDVELLEYQRSRTTPKIVIQQFADEDERSQAFREQEEKEKQELFSQFYQQHLKAKFENATKYTLEDVAQHNSELDCWTVVEGRVYNIAPFLA